MNKPYKLFYLIRHGQSQGNVESDATGIIHGRMNPSSLTEKGRDQVKSAAQALASKYSNRPVIIWHSPTVRTTESAKIIKEYLPHAQLIADERLLDVHFGELEGHTWEWAMKNHPTWIARFMVDRLDTPFPGGESMRQLHERLESLTTEAITHPETIHIFVTHEEPVRALLSLCHPSDPGYYHDRKRVKIPNGSISVVYRTPKRRIVMSLSRFTTITRVNITMMEKAFDLYQERHGYPTEFIPRMNFSDNKVFSATSDNEKLTVKLIPESFRADVEKDKLLSTFFGTQKLPVPKYIYEQDLGDLLYAERTYVAGTIAHQWLESPDAIKAAGAMGGTLRLLHQVPLKEIPLPHHTKNSWIEEYIKPWIHEDLKALKDEEPTLYPKVKKYLQTFVETLKIPSITFLHNDLSSYNLALKQVDGTLQLCGIWDFERSLTGDPHWDIAMTRKISMLGHEDWAESLLSSYYEGTISQSDRAVVNFYTVMIITGSIRYRKNLGRPTTMEVENLQKHFSQLSGE